MAQTAAQSPAMNDLAAEDPEEETKQEYFQRILLQLTRPSISVQAKNIHRVAINYVRTMEGLVDQIYDKAMTDSQSCELCAMLCRVLTNKDMLPQFADPSSPSGTPTDFRRLLLNKCQMAFQSFIIEDAPAEATSEAWHRYVINAEFIAHLYTTGIMTEKILHICITSLLRDKDNPRPVDVECLCKLLTVAGRQLDASKKKEYKLAMEAYTQRLRAMRNNPCLEARVQSMVQGVLDLKASNWVVPEASSAQQPRGTA